MTIDDKWAREILRKRDQARVRVCVITGRRDRVAALPRTREGLLRRALSGEALDKALRKLRKEGEHGDS